MRHSPHSGIPTSGSESENQETIRALLKKIRAGDSSVANQLFELLSDGRFRSAILAATRRFLPRAHQLRNLVGSDDLVQSAWRTGMENLADFRGSTEGELYVWLREIVRGKISKIARRKSRALCRDDVPPDEILRDEVSPIEAVLDSELQEELARSIESLSVDHRLVIELRLQGFSGPDIAQILGLKPAAVRQRESRAVRLLRERLA